MFEIRPVLVELAMLVRLRLPSMTVVPLISSAFLTLVFPPDSTVRYS